MAEISSFASPSLVPLCRGSSRAKEWVYLFPHISKVDGTKLSWWKWSHYKGSRFVVTSVLGSHCTYAWPDKKRSRVCILGNGFGGLYTALRLESLEWPDDGLVLALGAEVKLDVVRGAAEYALPFSTLEDACKVDDKLNALERINFGKENSIRVAVIGCEYSGIKLTATIAERLRDRGLIQAINAVICPSGPPGNREAAMKVLESQKVQLLLSYLVRSITKLSVPGEEKIGKYVLELQPAQRELQIRILEVDLVLWTVGSKPSLPELESQDQPNKLPLTVYGQVEPMKLCVALRKDSKGRLLPTTVQVAFQQADFTGWNLWATINDRLLLPFRFQNLAEMITLRRNNAAISPSFIDGLTLDGPVGHAARKITYLMRLPTDEHRVKVGIGWLAKSAVDC